MWAIYYYYTYQEDPPNDEAAWEEAGSQDGESAAAEAEELDPFLEQGSPYVAFSKLHLKTRDLK